MSKNTERGAFGLVQDCMLRMVVVFDDMLGSNRKIIDSFLSRDDIMLEMFIIYHNQILIYLKEQLGTTFTLYFYFDRPCRTYKQRHSWF